MPLTNEELIAALEAADGPSRELDAEIGVATGHFVKLLKTVAGTFVYRENGDSARAPAYTSSFDAAMMLAKEGQASDILCDAIVLLNVTGWKGRWRDALPRFIVIAALKAKGEG